MPDQDPPVVWADARTMLGMVEPYDETIFERIRYLIPDYVYDERHLAIIVDGLVVAATGIEESKPGSGEWWIKFVSVDPDHRDKGHARRMVTTLYEWANENGQKLVQGSLTDDGAMYLSRLLADMRERYPHVTDRAPRLMGGPHP